MKTNRSCDQYFARSLHLFYGLMRAGLHHDLDTAGSHTTWWAGE